MEGIRRSGKSYLLDPIFNLVASGSGTKGDPFRIKI